jgi:hypothetical protein
MKDAMSTKKPLPALGVVLRVRHSSGGAMGTEAVWKGIAIMRSIR